MAELPKKIREHYEGQKLSEERLRAILAAGQAARARRAGTRWWWGLAALLAVGLSVFLFERSRSPANGTEVPSIRTADVALAVRSFFAEQDYQLAQISARPAELQAWLEAQGAPAFSLPEGLRDRPSFGCQVLQVGARDVFLICFFLDGTAEELTSDMPVKTEMTVTGADGSMMKKTRPLVHLVVAPRAAFATPPTPGQIVSSPGEDGWPYRAWSEGDVVYVATADAAAADLAAALGHL